MKVLLSLAIVTLFAPLAIKGQWDPHFKSGHNGIVHLFEWKYNDIADECERFLGPNRFGGVQTSVPTENTVIELEWLSTVRPWWERYQPISYKLDTRSGSEAEFANMCRRCNAAGVRIFPDIVLNHMSATTGYGTAGSWGLSNTTHLDFPGVPFTKDDFNPYCSLDWNSQASIRDCWLIGLPDLNQKIKRVSDAQIELLNRMINYGVGGFRIDAAKHMWFDDLKYIFGSLHNLNTAQGFPANARAFIFQEVITGDGINLSDYAPLGPVTVFEASRLFGQTMRGHAGLYELFDMPNRFGIRPQEALVFVDNHDNQRDGGLPLTNHKEPRIYAKATAFNLAFGWGHPRLMSSFAFSHRDQGPPQDANRNVLAPTFDANGQCNNGWVCEHRWPGIKGMVKFSAVVRGEPVENVWFGNGEAGFSRGNKGFFVVNARDWGDNSRERLYTGLPAGTYCDMATGDKVGSSCSGKTVTVGGDGYADFEIPGPYSNEDGFVAIHVESKL